MGTATAVDGRRRAKWRKLRRAVNEADEAERQAGLSLLLPDCSQEPVESDDCGSLRRPWLIR